MTDSVFPPSVQSILWNYLKPQQQETLKPILRLIKPPYQTLLCISLLDYMEGNGLDQLDNPLLDRLQRSIINECNLTPLSR